MTEHDHKICREAFDELDLPCGSCHSRCVHVDNCDCDCHEATIVVLSTGYADVNRDGGVVQYGRVIAHLEAE